RPPILNKQKVNQLITKVVRCNNCVSSTIEKPFVIVTNSSSYAARYDMITAIVCN
ncbi:unnamed protein product, partial [Rotaria sordida]